MFDSTIFFSMVGIISLTYAFLRLLLWMDTPKSHKRSRYAR